MDEQSFTVAARPYPFTFPREHTALLAIDMQRDFLLDRGFGALSQGNDLTPVQDTIAPIKHLLAIFRTLGMAVIHTREGHLPDLSDCPSSKLLRNLPVRQEGALKIGDQGPLGRLLVRGEYGHDIVNDVAPLPSEVVIDKPGKGAFWNTELMDALRARAITHLVVCGVTTECCFATTIREANDRGFECCGIIEATAGYEPEFKETSLRMLDFAGGLFGFTASIDEFKKIQVPQQISAFTPTSANGHGLNGKSHLAPICNGDLSIDSLTAYYKSGGTIVNIVNTLFDRIEAYLKVNPAVWVCLERRENVLKAAAILHETFSDRNARPPLFGIPFSIKDNIDVANIPTTVSCPPLAYTPVVHSRVHQKLLEAGGLYLGKVILDQFATGLTGCRSLFGIPHSVYSPAFVTGGSSSGSAVSVGASLVTFSIGTDTAGSGRVPPGFNGVVGFKPTRGTVSAVGVVPACPSLDTVALLAKTVTDARKVWHVLAEFDSNDPYAKWAVSRPRPVHALGLQKKSYRFAIPPENILSEICPVYQRQFKAACAKLQAMGGIPVVVDWTPFHEAGKLMYQGTFVSERLSTLPDGWVQKNKDRLHPVISKLLQDVEARHSTAADAYRDMNARMGFTRQAEQIFRAANGGIDVLVVPTTPIHFTIKEVEASPWETNSRLGTFTHCGNIMDLCAVATPAGEYPAVDLGERCPKESRDEKLPFSVTFLGMSGTDAEILELAKRFQTTA